MMWQPEGKRARGRPKSTWRRTVEKVRNTAGWISWNDTKIAARDRSKLKESIKDEKKLMLSKRYETTEDGRRTWLHVCASGT